LLAPKVCLGTRKELWGATRFSPTGGFLGVNTKPKFPTGRKENGGWTRSLAKPPVGPRFTVLKLWPINFQAKNPRFLLFPFSPPGKILTGGRKLGVEIYEGWNWIVSQNCFFPFKRLEPRESCFPPQGWGLGVLTPFKGGVFSSFNFFPGIYFPEKDSL